MCAGEAVTSSGEKGTCEAKGGRAGWEVQGQRKSEEHPEAGAGQTRSGKVRLAGGGPAGGWGTGSEDASEPLHAFLPCHISEP